MSILKSTWIVVIASGWLLVSLNEQTATAQKDGSRNATLHTYSQPDQRSTETSLQAFLIDEPNSQSRTPSYRDTNGLLRHGSEPYEDSRDVRGATTRKR